jgi:RNA recognition motif-containing protein
MNKKLYVGNLSYKTTEEELRELFAGVGNVISAVVITDRMTGRSKGFGFVEFENAEDAQKAVEKFNNYSFMDRNLTVNEARPQGEGSFGGGGGGGRFNDRRSGGSNRGGSGGNDRRRY